MRGGTRKPGDFYLVLTASEAGIPSRVIIKCKHPTFIVNIGTIRFVFIGVKWRVECRVVTCEVRVV